MCEVKVLVDPTGTVISPFNQILELPSSKIFMMPDFMPDPLCGYSSDNIDYKLSTLENTKVPDWITINPSKH